MELHNRLAAFTSTCAQLRLDVQLDVNAVKLLCSSMVRSPLVQALVQVRAQLIVLPMLNVNLMIGCTRTR